MCAVNWNYSPIIIFLSMCVRVSPSWLWCKRVFCNSPCTEGLLGLFTFVVSIASYVRAFVASIVVVFVLEI